MELTLFHVIAIFGAFFMTIGFLCGYYSWSQNNVYVIQEVHMDNLDIVSVHIQKINKAEYEAQLWRILREKYTNINYGTLPPKWDEDFELIYEAQK